MKKEDEVKKVEVKILKHVGSYIPGQIVALPEAMAEELCKVTKLNNGHGLVDHQKAVLMSDLENFARDLDLGKVDLSKITQHELQELGYKNVVKNAPDAALEAKLAQLSKPTEGDDIEALEEEQEAEESKKGKSKKEK